VVSERHKARVAKAREATRLRLQGTKWQDIADELGYGSAGAAYNAVWREFDPDYWRKRAEKEHS